MTLLEIRHDDSEIARRYLAPSAAAASWIDVLKGHPHEWRAWLRHLYVLTWPLSFFTRILIFIAVGLMWLALGIGGFIAARLAYIWVGERSPWD